MTSVLECSADLRGVQSELQIDFTINCFGFRVILDSAKKKWSNLYKTISNGERQKGVVIFVKLTDVFIRTEIR